MGNIFLLAFFIASMTVYGQSDSAISGNHAAFGELLMKFKTGGRIFSSPIISQGTAYVGSGDGSLYAIDIRSKKEVWKFNTGGAVQATPVFFEQVVYFGSDDGYFYALDASSGRLIWRFKTAGEKKEGRKGLWTMKPLTQYMEDPFDFFLSSPCIDERDSVVYFGSGDGNIYALHTNTGAQLWKFKTDGIVHSSPALYSGKVYVGSWDRNVYALDAHSGEEKWRFKTGEDTAYHLLEGIQASPAIYDSTVYVGSRDGYFYALDPWTGVLKWKYSVNNSWILTTPAFKDKTVYLGTSDSYQFIALDTRTGKEKFKVQASGYVYSSPSVSGHIAYFGDFTGKMFAVDLNANGKIIDTFMTEGRKNNADRVLLKDKIDFGYAAKSLDLSLYASTITGMENLYSLGPILSRPLISECVIYFGSADGYLYALRLKYPEPYMK